jgi:hypothetical protein
MQSESDGAMDGNRPNGGRKRKQKQQLRQCGLLRCREVKGTQDAVRKQKKIDDYLSRKAKKYAVEEAEDISTTKMGLNVAEPNDTLSLVDFHGENTTPPTKI